MIARRLKIAGAILIVAVIAEAFYLANLRHRVQRLFQTGRTDEQIRRDITQPPIATPSDVKVKAKMFWASSVEAPQLEPVEVELPLSADPVQRTKQLINALVAMPVAEQRTLPVDATLVEFYLLPDGTGVADFSDTLSTTMPSGIVSEQMAVDSIVKTLGANVDAVKRLKILIHGQEAETLAGHVDLTGVFIVHAGGGTTPGN